MKLKNNSHTILTITERIDNSPKSVTIEVSVCEPGVYLKCVKIVHAAKDESNNIINNMTNYYKPDIIAYN